MSRNELEWADSDVSLNNYFSASNNPSLQLLKLQVLNLVQFTCVIPNGVPSNELKVLPVSHKQCAEYLSSSRCWSGGYGGYRWLSNLLTSLWFEIIFSFHKVFILHREKFKVLCSHWRCPIGRSQSVTEGMICSMWVKVYGQCADNCSSTR